MMGVDEFRDAYRDLENRWREQAEQDGHVYLPHPEPTGPADAVLVAMEPSLGRWARNHEDARMKIAAGFRNLHPVLLHYAIRHYLLQPGERYYITDFSKGAMLTGVRAANQDRARRYERWYPLLLRELALVARPGAPIVVLGRTVEQELERLGFGHPFTRILHYSSQAARYRATTCAGHEEAFEGWVSTVRHEDILVTARALLAAARMPAPMAEVVMAFEERRRLSHSDKQLLFGYKLVFERLRLERSVRSVVSSGNPA